MEIEGDERDKQVEVKEAGEGGFALPTASLGDTAAEARDFLASRPDPFARSRGDQPPPDADEDDATFTASSEPNSDSGMSGLVEEEEDSPPIDLDAYLNARSTL